MAIIVTAPRDDVVQIALDRPEKLNALDAGMVRQLREALDDVDGDLRVRTVVLTGSGRGFCAGLDLDGFGDDELVERDGATIRTYQRQREIADLVTRIRTLRQPVIAAVNGPAAGGGLALVLAADIRMASTSAKFAVSFIRAGYSACDIGTSWMLPRLVGAGRAHELMLTGRTFTAKQALEYGLLVEITGPEGLISAALSKAAEIAQNPPFSVELTKAGMWQAVETGTQQASIEFENRQQLVSAFTEDAREATAAFLEKRPAAYRRR